MLHARKDYNRIQDPSNIIPEKEPVFLIRGQDRIGSTVVRLWSIINFLTFGSMEASKLAYAHAKKMKLWPKKKACDLPTELVDTISSYSGDNTAKLHVLADKCSTFILEDQRSWEEMDFTDFVDLVGKVLEEINEANGLNQSNNSTFYSIGETAEDYDIDEEFDNLDSRLNEALGGGKEK